MKEVVDDIKLFFADKTAQKIIAIGFIVRVIIFSIMPLGFDEAYYGLYADNPAWGYFDHPPLVSLTAGIGLYLTGIYSALTLRLGAILLFILSSIIMYVITLRLFNKKAALFSVILFHIIPYFLFGMGAFVIPDNSLGFFWLAFLYGLLLLQQTSNNKYLLLSGAMIGFALLSKYHGVLLIGGVGVLLIFYKSWWKYWKNPFLYIALALTFIIFLPNILWNAEHDWLSYAYQFGKSSDGMNVSMTKFLQGIFVQMGYLFPWNMILILTSIVSIIKMKKKEAYFLIPFVLIPICIFTAIGATRQILPHWPMPGYLAGIVLLSGVMFHWKEKNIKRFIIPSVVMTLLVAVIISLQSLTGFLPLQKNADITLDGQGWDQVADELIEQNFINDTTFVFTYKWFTSGQLSFALENKFPVPVLNKKSPHHFSQWYDYSSFTGKDGIFVCTERFNERPDELFGDYFLNYELLNTFEAKRNNETAQKFFIWRCKKLQRKFETLY